MLYALASAAVLGMPAFAQADIITHVLTEPVTRTSWTNAGVGNYNNYYKLDFDGNGAYDGLLAATHGSGSSQFFAGVLFAGRPSVAGGSDDATDLPGGSIETLLSNPWALAFSEPGAPPTTFYGPLDPAGRDAAILGLAHFPNGYDTVVYDGLWGDRYRSWLSVQFQLDGGRQTTGWADVETRFFRGDGAQFTVYALAYDNPTTVPEPSLLWMLGSGVVWILIAVRRSTPAK